MLRLEHTLSQQEQEHQQERAEKRMKRMTRMRTKRMGKRTERMRKRTKTRMRKKQKRMSACSRPPPYAHSHVTIVHWQPPHAVPLGFACALTRNPCIRVSLARRAHVSPVAVTRRWQIEVVAVVVVCGVVCVPVVHVSMVRGTCLFAPVHTR